MGILNASPESFSGSVVGIDDAVEQARRLRSEGAGMLDIGGQSLRTDQDELAAEREVERIRPVIEKIAADLPDLPISVDTYRVGPARVALALGASVVNDVSGMADPGIVELAAEAGARYVLTYNRARPKVRLAASQLVTDLEGDAAAFLEDRLAEIDRIGLPREQLVFDPGIDLGKSPAQSIEMIRLTKRLRDDLGLHSVLWALSRKDFVGALVERYPRERDPGTLGALAAADPRPADLLRIHAVRDVADFLLVRSAVSAGDHDGLELAVDLRHNPPAG